jgi:TRAP-type C4-dicarboxylate transport system permease small subunit
MIEKIGQKLDVVLGAIAGLILISMMLITAVDVFARYAFNTPIRGAFELTEILLALLIYAGLPLVSRREAHVVVDLFESWMSEGVKRVLRVVGNLLCLVALAGMSWVIYARRVVDHSDTTAVLKLPLTPVAMAIAVLLLLTGLVHVALIFTRPPAEETTSAL